MGAVVWSSFVQTLYMVFWSTLLSVILGFIPALVLTLTAPDGLRPNKVVYETLSLIVNIFRSFPFIILLIIIIPFTRLIIGKAIGTRAAVVPLTVSAIPYIARIFETSLRLMANNRQMPNRNSVAERMTDEASVPKSGTMLASPMAAR